MLRRTIAIWRLALQLGRGSRGLLITLTTLALAGCNFFGGAHVETPVRLLLSPGHVTLYMAGDQGAEEQLPSSALVSAKVLGSGDTPLEGQAAEVRWEASDETIVQVNDQGRVTAVSTGSATIVSISAANPSLRATVSVTVQDAGRADVVVR